MSLSSINDMDSHNLIIALYSDALGSDSSLAEPQFTITGKDYSTLTWAGTDMPKPTEAELVAKYNSTKIEVRDKLVRERRDQLLVDSDKYAVKDFPFRTKGKKTEWITYRTNLRNLTDNLSSFTLDLGNLEITNFDTVAGSHNATTPADEGNETITFSSDDTIVDGKLIMPTNTLNYMLVGDSTSYEEKSPSQVRTALDLEVGTDIQAYDIALNALSGITPSSNKIPMFKDGTSCSLLDFKDENDMSSDSVSAIPSQRSVKAYVTTEISGKQSTIDSSSDISINNLTTTGNIACGGSLTIDTINEKTSTSGVTIEGVLLKNNTLNAGSNSTVTASNFYIGSKNVISATSQGSFRDIEIKDNSNNVTFLASGDTGNLELSGTITIDTINEKTSTSGVTIEGVLLKNNTLNAGSNSTVTASNFYIGSKNVISATSQGSFRDIEIKDNSNNVTFLASGDTGNLELSGTITIDTINEKTSTSGVTIEGVLLKDNNITCTNLSVSGTSSVVTQTSSDNSTKIASTAFVKTEISNLVDSAPNTLDTLNELAAALGDDANFSTTITTSLGEKLVKTNNLSDLDNVSTAITNLGLEIGSDVQAFNSNLVPVTVNPGSGTTLTSIGIDGTNYSISGGVTISNNVINRVLTGDGTNANAEGNMTFDGSSLNVVGTIICDSFLKIDSSILDASDILHISDITAGTATASKAVVLNASKGVTGITSLESAGLECPIISTSSNANLELDPNGSGVVIFKGNATRGSAEIKLNCSTNGHGITIKGPPHSAGAIYTLTLPNTDGDTDQVLKTDGSGNLSWTTVSGGGGGGLPSGVTYSGSIFNVDGNIRATQDITAFYSSDRRFKDNLVRISEPNEKIKKINGYEFDWNEKHELYKNTHDVGVVAQEIEEVLPEVVVEREDGYKAVKYEKIIALLIESNKDLLRRVEELEEKCKK